MPAIYPQAYKSNFLKSSHVAEDMANFLSDMQATFRHDRHGIMGPPEGTTLSITPMMKPKLQPFYLRQNSCQ